MLRVAFVGAPSASLATRANIKITKRTQFCRSGKGLAVCVRAHGSHTGSDRHRARPFYVQ